MFRFIFWYRIIWIECLSRQAKSHSVFVEKEKGCNGKILEKNIEKLKVKNKIKVFLK